jgi:hypothetical protein
MYKLAEDKHVQANDMSGLEASLGRSELGSVWIGASWVSRWLAAGPTGVSELGLVRWGSQTSLDQAGKGSPYIKGIYKKKNLWSFSIQKICYHGNG